MKNLLQKP
jgi:hypothetical protein